MRQITEVWDRWQRAASVLSGIEIECEALTIHLMETYGRPGMRKRLAAEIQTARCVAQNETMTRLVCAREQASPEDVAELEHAMAEERERYGLDGRPRLRLIRGGKA